MEKEFLLFNPDQYYDFEIPEITRRRQIASGEIAQESFPPDSGKPIREEDILAYNRIWNPHDPLYNDPNYARAHGHPGIPAFPGFEYHPPRGPEGWPHSYGSKFYYTMDRMDFRLFKNTYAGDRFVPGDDKNLFMTDLTLPDSNARVFELGGEVTYYDQNGDPFMHAKGNVLEGYSFYKDGSRMDISENLSEWVHYLPEPHYTTDDDYLYMKTIWDQEVINGDNTPFWEDVSVGQELPKTCSDGPVTYIHMMYWHNIGDLSIYTRDELMDPEMRAVTYRDRFGAFLDETALHYSGRNIPNVGGVFYNDTAARLIARTLTNFIGNKGRISRFGWKLFPFFRELRVRPIDAEMFNKVPGMEGRVCEQHGAEGDTVIGRAVITDKYINDRGEHCCEVALWAENLEGKIIQSCPSEIVLPSRAG